MPNQEEFFVRNFEIDTLNISLKLYQKFEGDVGCVVWDASIVLAKYLEELFKKNQNVFKNLNVIELGSGVGCVGLTAACLGAKVLLTDLPEILPVLEKNIESNSDALEWNTGKAQAASLRWGEPIKLEQLPNLILLADCVYYMESIEKLVITLRNLAGPATKILMTQELRESEKQQYYWNHFFDTIKGYFTATFVPLEDQNEEFRSDDILLIELLPL